MRVDYEDLYAPDIAQNRRQFELIARFLGVTLPVDADLDEWLNPEHAKLNSAASYSCIPNAREIDAALGSDETGRLFESAGP
jgi:hypothetical protein